MVHAVWRTVTHWPSDAPLHKRMYGSLSGVAPVVSGAYL